MTVIEVSPSIPQQQPQRRALLPRNPTPWGVQEPLTPPPAVQRLLQQVGGASYRTYQPFQVMAPLITPECSQDPPERKSQRNNEPCTPPALTQLCRNFLLTQYGLKTLRQLLVYAKAPKCAVKFLTNLSAKECVVR